ncbi:leucine-rich repeat domain-containing protein [Chryseobacterium candidae]|nr:hypothetical protein [Chryseobacterium candidae]
MNKQQLKELSRRIEEAKKQEQQEKRLDLSGLSLNNEALLRAMSEIEKISGMTELDLGGNNLNKLPSNIFTLINLKRLKLDRNKFTDLPEEFELLDNLEKLDVSHNRLLYLPDKIGRSSNLKDLNVSNNELLFLPDLSGFRKLERLDLSNNRYLMKLPEEIGNLSKLTKLNVIGTGIEDIPEDLKLLNNLERAEVGLNKLFDEPEEIDNPSNLKALNFSNNEQQLKELSRRIEEAKKQEQQEKRLDLSGLSLNNEALLRAMSEIEKISGMTELDLGGNNLNKLPSNIFTLINLKRLKLDRNKFTDLPEEFELLDNLEKLDVSHNRLLYLPDKIGRSSNLKDLNVSNNELLFLPDLSGFRKLERLDLSTNNLKKLPEDIGNLSNLTKLNVNGNLIKNLPEGFELLKNLKALDFRKNRLSDEAFNTIKDITEKIKQVHQKSDYTLRTLYPNDKELEEIRLKIENPDLGSTSITIGDKKVEIFSKNVVEEFLSEIPLGTRSDISLYYLPAKDQLMKMINDDSNLIDVRDLTLNKVAQSLADGNIKDYLTSVDAERRKLYPLSELPIESAQSQAESQGIGSAPLTSQKVLRRESTEDKDSQMADAQLQIKAQGTVSSLSASPVSPSETGVSVNDRLRQMTIVQLPAQPQADSQVAVSTSSVSTSQDEQKVHIRNNSSSQENSPKILKR